ncbi:hypothetical protein N7G274_005527 [Stereocaulon virgatum]|uniref:Uncharacterized protein n=1 Tax=Stereocaulon virgatum TaxID=373712 RepID=A0ABR4A7T0_9LECA
MRKTSLPNLVRASRHAMKLRPCSSRLVPFTHQPPPLTTCRTLAQVRSDREVFPELWFTSSRPSRQTPEEGGGVRPNDVPPPNERTLKLGKTLRILQSRLPTLLASPLPPEILSPHITLHLFPSTHPHLPTVSGRVAYHAALWTAPMAWGRVPIVGNVRLIILSERMVKNGPTTFTSDSSNDSNHSERLIVRWKTCGKTKGKGMGAFYKGIGASEQVDKITEWLGGDARDDEEFCGLFIFEFDGEGKIVSHIIEHVEEGRDWEKTSRVVSVTDWLLGRMGGRSGEGGFALSLADGGGGNQGRRRFEGRGLELWR